MDSTCSFFSFTGMRNPVVFILVLMFCCTCFALPTNAQPKPERSKGLTVAEGGLVVAMNRIRDLEPGRYTWHYRYRDRDQKGKVFEDLYVHGLGVTALEGTPALNATGGLGIYFKVLNARELMFMPMEAPGALIFFHAREGMADSMATVLQGMAALARGGKSNFLFDLYQGQTDPNRFFIHQRWKGKISMGFFYQGEKVQEMQEVLGRIKREPEEIFIVESVPLEGGGD